jgi:hypothetical protein
MHLNFGRLGRLHIHTGAAVDRHVSGITEALQNAEALIRPEVPLRSRVALAVLHKRLKAAANELGVGDGIEVEVDPASGGLIKPPSQGN